MKKPGQPNTNKIGFFVTFFCAFFIMVAAMMILAFVDDEKVITITMSILWPTFGVAWVIFVVIAIRQKSAKQPGKTTVANHGNEKKAKKKVQFKKELREAIHKSKETPHIYENESGDHRYDPPSFDISDRFSKEESKKEQKQNPSGGTGFKICPRCGYINDEHNEFCVQCSAPLPSKTQKTE